MEKQLTFKNHTKYLKLMSKINDLAKEYADYILLMRKDMITSLIEIERKIKTLRYTETGKPISIEDKEKIFKEMERLFLTNNEELILKFEDYTEFVILIEALRKNINK